MTETELIRRLFENYGQAEAARQRHSPLPGHAESLTISDLTLYAAHLRFLLRCVLKCEQVVELLNVPGLPELRQVLKCLIDMEAKVGFPEEWRLKNPLER